jgi:hypothetical protein
MIVMNWKNRIASPPNKRQRFSLCAGLHRTVNRKRPTTNMRLLTHTQQEEGRASDKRKRSEL